MLWKKNFRNCWNDLLLLSKCINEGATLITFDKLLNKFASELYEGQVTKKKRYVQIQFPQKDKYEDFYKKRESKGYINRSWDYKIRKGT